MYIPAITTAQPWLRVLPTWIRVAMQDFASHRVHISQVLTPVNTTSTAAYVAVAVRTSGDSIAVLHATMTPKTKMKMLVVIRLLVSDGLSDMIAWA